MPRSVSTPSIASAGPSPQCRRAAARYFIDELTLAVSGAAGTAAIAAAKMGLNTLAVGGVGDDLMGDWVLQRLQHFGVDTSAMQQSKAGRHPPRSSRRGPMARGPRCT